MIPWHNLFGEPECLFESAGSEIRAYRDGWTKDGRTTSLSKMSRADLKLIEPELPQVFEHLGMSAHARLSSIAYVRAITAAQGAHVPTPVKVTAKPGDAA